MCALTLGRPLGVVDSDCDVELPVDVDDDKLPEYFALGAQVSRRQLTLMAGTNALTGLYKIAGRVLQEVYALDFCKDHLMLEKIAELQRSVESIDKELTKWYDDLPVEFKSEQVDGKQHSMSAILFAHYNSIRTTLHRRTFLLFGGSISSKSTTQAIFSARSFVRLARLINDDIRRSRYIIPFSHHLAFFVQHLFSSAVIILFEAVLMPNSKAASTTMEEGRSCLSDLESWEVYWPGARRCRELLTDLTAIADDVIKVAASGIDSSGVP